MLVHTTKPRAAPIVQQVKSGIQLSIVDFSDYQAFTPLVHLQSLDCLTY